MSKKHSPGCQCCGTTCEDACSAVSPLTSAEIVIENGTADTTFTAPFHTSASFDCSVSTTECRIKDEEKTAEAECTNDWTDEGVPGVLCNCGYCEYVPDDPEDPIPFPTPLGDPFPPTTFNRIERGNRDGWKVVEWEHRGYVVSVSIAPSTTTAGNVDVVVYYQVGVVKIYNFLYANQYRYRAHTYNCPGGPAPASTGAWNTTTDPFPLDDPPFPCERIKPVSLAGETAGCETPDPGVAICEPKILDSSPVGYNETLSCHPSVPCGYIVTSDPVYWGNATFIQSHRTNDECGDCNPLSSRVTFYGPCSIPFNGMSIRYERTFVYILENVPCEDLRDGPLTLSRADGTTSDETVTLYDGFSYSCDGGIDPDQCDAGPLELDSPAITLDVPWQVTVTLT